MSNFNKQEIGKKLHALYGCTTKTLITKKFQHQNNIRQNKKLREVL
jgi:hypothetical protein